MTFAGTRPTLAGAMPSAASRQRGLQAENVRGKLEPLHHATRSP